MFPLLFIGSIGFPETVVILIVGLLIFGSRLPEVGRTVGRGLMELKKGLKGFQDQVGDIDRDTDRAIDDELSRRRLEASAHDLDEDPRTPPSPFADLGATQAVQDATSSEDPSDGQPDADQDDDNDSAPKESDFVDGDPARDEVLGPRHGFASHHDEDNEEFISPVVPPAQPKDDPSSTGESDDKATTPEATPSTDTPT